MKLDVLPGVVGGSAEEHDGREKAGFVSHNLVQPGGKALEDEVAGLVGLDLLDGGRLDNTLRWTALTPE